MSRLIEQDSVRAFKYGRKFKRGNMQVTVTPISMGKELVQLKQHGNIVAERETGSGTFKVYHAGWNSVTTAGRINEVLSQFGRGYAHIEKGTIYFNIRDQGKCVDVGSFDKRGVIECSIGMGVY